MVERLGGKAIDDWMMHFQSSTYCIDRNSVRGKLRGPERWQHTTAIPNHSAHVTAVANGVSAPNDMETVLQ